MTMLKIKVEWYCYVLFIVHKSVDHKSQLYGSNFVPNWMQLYVALHLLYFLYTVCKVFYYILLMATNIYITKQKFFQSVELGIRSYLPVETRVRAESPIETLDQLSSMIRIIARERSRNNIPMHHHRANVPLIQPKFIDHTSPTTEHRWRSKCNNWKKRGGGDCTPSTEHEIDEQREAATKRVACKSELGLVTIAV